MSSIEKQFLNFKSHHSVYPAIDPETTLKGSADGKVIYISGASDGIGRATAVAFAQAGAKAVYISARSEDGLRKTMELVKEANPDTECAFRTCDVTDATQVQASVNECVEMFGSIDAADANAGFMDTWVKIGESDPAEWWKTWEVNILGAYNIVRYVMPHLITSAAKHAAQGSSGGHLILVSSVGGLLITGGASAYQTTKYAVNRLCEFIDVDHGVQGVKCFAVHPGGVKTRLAVTMPDEWHRVLSDDAALPAGFSVWLASGKADWAKGRYLSAKWDIGELEEMKEEILKNDLLVSRLRGEV